ncbi:Cell division protein FtsZ [hydrothermal vent metagenome]|uniref:Cell division protein FtsZ n=1 Tax=hydrothermal vent metagenome TaxID=652676 RepID=A0A1W1EI09_9ZZZZ
MEEFDIKEISRTDTKVEGAQITAIGVGGGGGNMINHMITQSDTDINLIAANTDAQALSTNLATSKLQLGINATRGLGAGMQPEKGRDAALESFEETKKALDGSDIVFISAGLGGGTGTGAAPIIAQAAKDVGALTVSVVTTPFKFEGRKRTKLALAGLDELKAESDCIIIVPNERLLSIVEKNLGMKESFRLVDDILSQAVGGISNVILSHGENDINLDFADVKTVMSHKGMALMGVGHSEGSGAAINAAKMAMESPLLNDVSINGAMGILVHFHINPEYPMLEMSDAMETIEENADEDANVIFGTTTDESLPIDAVQLTIIATGFEAKDLEKMKSTTTTKTPKKETISKPSPRELFNRERMVVNGTSIKSDDHLDIPTFLRRQMD